MLPVGFGWRSNLLFGGLGSYSKNAEAPVQDSQFEPGNAAPAAISASILGTSHPASGTATATQNLRVAVGGVSSGAESALTAKVAPAGIGCSIQGAAYPSESEAIVRQTLRSVSNGRARQALSSGAFSQTLRSIVGGETAHAQGAALVSAEAVATPVLASIGGSTAFARGAAVVKAQAPIESPPVAGYSGLVQHVFHKREVRPSSWEKYIPKVEPQPLPIGCRIQTETAPPVSRISVRMRLGSVARGVSHPGHSNLVAHLCLSSGIRAKAGCSESSLQVSQSDPELEDFLALVLEGFL